MLRVIYENKFSKSCSGNRVGPQCESCATGYTMRNNVCEIGKFKKVFKKIFLNNEAFFCYKFREDVFITITTTSIQLEQNQNYTVFVTINGVIKSEILLFFFSFCYNIHYLKGVMPTQSTWTKQGSQRLPFNVVQQGNNLVIVSASRQMTGYYIFTVYTVYGSVTKTIYIKVTGKLNNNLLKYI